jgi:hypothetical protein
MGTLPDVGHVLLHELMRGLVRFPDLANLLEDLVPILYCPNHLAEAVGQDLVNRGGRLGGGIPKYCPGPYRVAQDRTRGLNRWQKGGAESSGCLDP